jgi:hypothetical protein
MIHRFIFAALLALAGRAHAATGLWQPAELPAIEQALRSAGIAVDPRELADLQRYPMSAVVDLGDGCTAALVSPLGLMLTSRHCARRSVAFNPTVDRNLQADGFVASTLGEELPGGPGLALLLTQSAQDVTMQVQTVAAAGGAAGESVGPDPQRILRLEAACEVAAGFRCRVHPVQGGARYILVKQLQIRDLRLAYAPAAVAETTGAASNPGGPRHAGDFALFRAYVGPHGRPAEFSELNVPLRPAAHLKLQPAGVTVGDFVLAISYPRAKAGSPTADGGASLRVGFGNVRAQHAVPGSMPVSFRADLDLPAGSSGSPVLNARAELIGVAVADEGTADAPEQLSDAIPARSIGVDIRHMLWLLGAVDGAHRLLQEMGIEAPVDGAPR